MMRVEDRERRGESIPGVVQLVNGRLEEVYSVVGLPPRVANRVLLHQKKFVKMFTGIIGPREQWGLDELRMMAKKAEKVNRQIGLAPRVNSVVLRTRDEQSYFPATGFQDRKARIGGVNTMLIVPGIRDYFPKFISISGSNNVKEEWPALAFWRQWRVDGQNHFLVHEENEEAQRGSIHGRVGWLNDGSCELSVGEGVLHARLIGDNGSPYVSMTGYDLSMGLEMLAENRGRLVGKHVTSFLPRLNSNNWKRANKMAMDVLPWVGELERLQTDLVPLLNPGVVFEFRLYRNQFGKAGLNVYDFDFRLGAGGVISMSGLRQSEEEIRDIALAR